MKALRQALRVGAYSAVTLLLFHWASVVGSLASVLRGLDPAVLAQVNAISLHVLTFQGELAVAVLVVGFFAGLVSFGVLILTGRQPRPSSGVCLSVLLVGAWMGRELARRPALFEDLLWRKGGLRASFERFMVERVGYEFFDRAAALLALALSVTALWRLRHTVWAYRKWVAVALCLAGLGAALAHLKRPASGDRRSIVILAADSLRMDHLSSEGYGRQTTPNIDALRQGGARVSELFVPIASTTAAWTSILSGLYPHHHGVRDLFPREEQTRLHAPLLTEVLGRAGYETAVVSDYAGESFSRMHLGFGRVNAPPATGLELFAEREMLQRMPIALALFTGSWAQRWLPVGKYLPVNADPDALSDKVEAELSRLEGTGRPFLLVAFYSVTHLPFAPTMPDGDRFTSRAYAGPSRYGYELQQLQDIDRLGERPSDAEVAQVRGLYDGALFGFDRQVGRLRARLQRDGLRNVTLVITGDHGENLFEPGVTTEHGKWFRGAALANRTPLIVDGPAKPLAPWPRHASSVDLMPTLLDLVGVPVPPGLDGQSLARPGAFERTFFAETTLELAGPRGAPPGSMTYPPVLELLEVEPRSHALVLKRRFEDVTVTAKLRAAYHPPWLLVHTPNPEGGLWELFDLERDPWESRELTREEPERAERLRRELQAWMAGDPLRWWDAADRLVRRVEQ